LNLAPCTCESPDYPLHLVDILNVNETEAADLARNLREKRGLRGGDAHQQQQQQGQQEKTTVFERAQLNMQELTSSLPHCAVIITLGDHGVLATYFLEEERQSIYLPAFKTAVVETTGAGDTFVGYFLAQLARGESFPRSLEVAGKAAALSVSRKGAMESIPRLKDVLAQMS